MEPVIFEDDVKYDLWLKIILAGTIVILVLMGIIFSKIESYVKVSGFPVGNYLISSNSVKNQIEIVRKRGWKIRISPNRLDLFVETLNRTLKDWETYQPR